jgi:hypothetical protein
MTSSPEGPLPVLSGAGELGGYLLGWVVPLAFCLGLIGLAVASLFEVAVPRWLILAEGAGCALLALLAPLLTRARQQIQPTTRQQEQQS